MENENASGVRQWWDGNSTRLWRLLVVAMWGLLSAIVLWGLARVAEMPGTYTTRAEVLCIRREIREGFRETNAKIDEVNRYLRDQAAFRQGGNTR